MNIEELRDLCLSLPATEEKFPFDEKTLVFYVGGKMYCLIDTETPDTMNLKGNPERNIELRELYESVRPGWHMNKNHWNTVDLDGDVDDRMLIELVKTSYELVFAGLKKSIRDEINESLRG